MLDVHHKLVIFSQGRCCLPFLFMEVDHGSMEGDCFCDGGYNICVFTVFTWIHQQTLLHLQSLTWNLKMMVSNRNLRNSRD